MWGLYLTCRELVPGRRDAMVSGRTDIDKTEPQKQDYNWEVCALRMQGFLGSQHKQLTR